MALLSSAVYFFPKMRVACAGSLKTKTAATENCPLILDCAISTSRVAKLFILL